MGSHLRPDWLFLGASRKLFWGNVHIVFQAEILWCGSLNTQKTRNPQSFSNKSFLLAPKVLRYRRTKLLKRISRINYANLFHHLKYYICRIFHVWVRYKNLMLLRMIEWVNIISKFNAIENDWMGEHYFKMTICATGSTKWNPQGTMAKFKWKVKSKCGQWNSNWLVLQ